MNRLMLALLAVVCLLAGADRALAQTPQSTMLVVTPGNWQTSQLPTYASAGHGCNLVSAWATSAGDLIGYVPGALNVVNERFNALFVGGSIPTATPLLLVCNRGSPAPVSTPPPPIPTAVVPTAPPLPPVPSGLRVVRTCIDGEFEGWEGDTPFLLCTGEVVVQTDGRYRYRYAYRPDVTLIGSGTSWEMTVEGINDSIRVMLVAGFKTCISGQFTGLRVGNIYPLCNGQVWRQSEAWTWSWSWYGPDVLVYESPFGGVKMKVLLSGVPHAVGVVRLQ